jgi:hypothetical protein
LQLVCRPSLNSFLSSCKGDDDDEGDDDEEDDDEAVDLLDLTSAVPPASEPIVPFNHPHQSIFYDKCVHRSSIITSGSSGTDESSSSMNNWLDDTPVMTSKEKKKVQKFMKRVSGVKRRFR